MITRASVRDIRRGDAIRHGATRNGDVPGAIPMRPLPRSHPDKALEDRLQLSVEEEALEVPAQHNPFPTTLRQPKQAPTETNYVSCLHSYLIFSLAD